MRSLQARLFRLGDNLNALPRAIASPHRAATKGRARTRRDHLYLVSIRANFAAGYSSSVDQIPRTGSGIGRLARRDHSGRVRQLVKEETGTPLMTYVRNLRMARARELLHTSFLSVKEIAAETPCSRVSGISTRFQAGRGRGERALTHCADAAMRPVRASGRSTITKVLKTRRDASAKIQLGATIIPLRSL